MANKFRLLSRDLLTQIYEFISYYFPAFILLQHM